MSALKSKFDKSVIEIVKQYLAKGYSGFQWEEMAEAVIRKLGIAKDREEEAATYGARAIRGYYRLGEQSWVKFDFTDVEIEHLLQLVEIEANFTMNRPVPPKVEKKEKKGTKATNGAPKPPTPEEIEATAKKLRDEKAAAKA
jgi:hypothetical protein